MTQRHRDPLLLTLTSDNGVEEGGTWILFVRITLLFIVNRKRLLMLFFYFFLTRQNIFTINIKSQIEGRNFLKISTINQSVNISTHVFQLLWFLQHVSCFLDEIFQVTSLCPLAQYVLSINQCVTGHGWPGLSLM